MSYCNCSMTLYSWWLLWFILPERSLTRTSTTTKKNKKIKINNMKKMKKKPAIRIITSATTSQTTSISNRKQDINIKNTYKWWKQYIPACDWWRSVSVIFIFIIIFVVFINVNAFIITCNIIVGIIIACRTFREKKLDSQKKKVIIKKTYGESK